MKMVSVHIELCTFAIISQKMICQKFHLNELVYARGYALIMENNQSIQIAQGYVVHLFREEMLLYHSERKYEYIGLTSTETDITLAINELHDINSVWRRLASYYNFNTNNEAARTMYDTFINRMIEIGAFESGNATLPIYGCAGKTYPMTLSVELTDQCNFNCTHCYKNASGINTHFIDTDVALKVFDDIADNVYSVDLTGGEALLHPNLATIVRASRVPELNLLTNGSLLTKVSPDILHLFDDIQISLYGCSENEYISTTRTHQFKNVCEGLRLIANENIPVTVTILLRQNNIKQIIGYISLLQELGIKRVRFGLTQKIGRNAGEISDWDVTYEDCEIFDKELEKAKNEFPHMVFNRFDWREDFARPPLLPGPYKIGCGAGTKSIAVSEKGMVRPCVMLPAEFFEVYTWDEYWNAVTRGKSLDMTECVSNCFHAYGSLGKTIDTICPLAFVPID